MEWRARAESSEKHKNHQTATVYRIVSDELEAALQREQEELLNLTQAAKVSGYSDDHLGRLVKDGIIPNAGRPGAPLIRRGNVPHRRLACVVGSSDG